VTSQERRNVEMSKRRPRGDEETSFQECHPIDKTKGDWHFENN